MKQMEEVLSLHLQQQQIGTKSGQSEEYDQVYLNLNQGKQENTNTRFYQILSLK